jgi:hypothetical protein
VIYERQLGEVLIEATANKTRKGSVMREVERGDCYLEGISVAKGEANGSWEKRKCVGVTGRR